MVATLKVVSRPAKIIVPVPSLNVPPVLVKLGEVLPPIVPRYRVSDAIKVPAA